MRKKPLGLENFTGNFSQYDEDDEMIPQINFEKRLTLQNESSKAKGNSKKQFEFQMEEQQSTPARQRTGRTNSISSSIKIAD